MEKKIFFPNLFLAGCMPFVSWRLCVCVSLVCQCEVCVMCVSAHCVCVSVCHFAVSAQRVRVFAADWMCDCVSGARWVSDSVFAARWVCYGVAGARRACDSVLAARWVCGCVSGARWVSDSVSGTRWV